MLNMPIGEDTRKREGPGRLAAVRTFGEPGVTLG